MKRISTMLVLGLMCSTPALADGNAMQSSSMSGSAMTNTSAMSGSNAMAPARPVHKTKVKAPTKPGGMSGQGATNQSGDAMKGQNGNAMNGATDNMAGPTPH
jgi:hypothetical protein